MDLRQKWKQEATREVDLLVIGGGITGAGIALDAQARGIETVLIEMQDFAAGTSSRSTKLVHGGLRYLKQGDVRLVSEVGRERAIVYENGPHVTKPEWMLLPIVKGGTYGKWASAIGLTLYDRLAGVKKSERRKMLNRDETLQREPLLSKKGLKGSGVYVEYRTDDARLTIEVLKKAVELGAKAFNYMKATQLLVEHGKVVGVQARDLLTDEECQWRAKKIVNATGPWVDELREWDGSKREKMLYWTKGVHLVVDHSRFPLKQAIYFDTSDGRMIFAIPREGKTYIGTTDTEYRGDLVHPRVTEADRAYLLQAVNGMFFDVNLTPADVETFWAGIRPLIHQAGKPPSEISRRDEIFRSETGLISIAGGKLTGYRKMAEKVVDLVAEELHRETGRGFAECQTDRIPISGGEVGGGAHFAAFVQEKVNQGMSLGYTKQQATWLAHLYGANVERVYQWATPEGKTMANRFNIPLDLYTSLMYGLKAEMVISPVDYLLRRTGKLLFDLEWVQRWKNGVIDVMAHQAGWDGQARKRWLTELEQEIKYVTEVKEESADS